MNKSVSPETQEKALKVARGTQKKGQTKEQTKLIAQGIEKGIAEYKKQQSQKSRERDKTRKQQLKEKKQQADGDNAVKQTSKNNNLPWVLLALSWLGFVGYAVILGNI